MKRKKKEKTREEKIAEVQANYIKKILEKIRPVDDIVSEMKRTLDVMLEAEKKEIRAEVLYFKGKYDALKWVFKEK